MDDMSTNKHTHILGVEFLKFGILYFAASWYFYSVMSWNSFQVHWITLIYYFQQLCNIPWYRWTTVDVYSCSSAELHYFVSSCFYTNIATVNFHVYMILQANESKQISFWRWGEIGRDRCGLWWNSKSDII